MKELFTIIDQLESHFPNHEKINLSISQSSIGWQLDHSLLVINGVITQLKNSNPNDYKWKFKWLRIVIKITNKIPRGKAKAPKVVQPVNTSTIEDLKAKLELAKKNIAELENLHPKNHFKHPYFGDLDLKTTIWFLKLHTKHHLKIVNDINSKS